MSSRRPRVALVAHEVYAHAGLGRVLAELVQRTHARVEWVVISRSLPDDLKPVVEWRRARAPERPFARRALAFFVSGAAGVLRSRARLVHAHGPVVPNRVDILTVHFYRRAFYEADGVLVARRPALRRAVTAANLALEAWCYRRARVLAAPSWAAKRDLERTFPEKRILVTPNGIDAARFRADPDTRRSLRDAESVADDAVVLLFVGNAWRQKGLRILLRALARARREREELVLWVVGYGSVERYRALAADAGVGAAVRFFGVRPDVERFYQAADVFVLPSVYETFALSAFEAAASGVPVVATPVGGVEELVGDEAGLVVTRDEEAVAAALILLARDRDLRTRMGQRAHLRAAAFTWERAAEAVLELYDQLLLEGTR